MDLLLPSTVLQGTSVFNELKLHCPPRNVAVMQIFISRFSDSSSSIKKPVEISARILPAVNSLQETRVLNLSMPKVSLVIPLVDFLVAWKAIPNVSQWVLHTVQKGYRIQLGQFNGVLATVVESVQA